jgi:hypothetical protein
MERTVLSSFQATRSTGPFKTTDRLIPVFVLVPADA